MILNNVYINIHRKVNYMDAKDKSRFQYMAEQARQNFTETEQYENFINATPQEKMDTLNARKTKTPTVDYMPNYELILDRLSRKFGENQIMLISIGTTGLDAKNGCGIMQCSLGLAYFDNTEGFYKLQNGKAASFITPVDKDMIDIADISKKNTGYDIFDNGGFNRYKTEGGLGISEFKYREVCSMKKPNGPNQAYEKILNDVGMVSNEYFAAAISSWMKYAARNEFPIVGVAPDFARPFLKNAGVKGLPDNALDIQELVRCHDFKEVMKETKDETYKGDYVSLTGKGFKMEDFAKLLNGEDKLYSTQEKVLLCVNILNDLAYREKILDKQAPMIDIQKCDGIVSYTVPSKETVKAKEGTPITLTGKETDVPQLLYPSEPTEQKEEVTEEQNIDYDQYSVTDEDKAKYNFYGKDGATVTIDGKETKISNEKENVTEKQPSANTQYEAIVRDEVAKEIEKRYSYIQGMIDKIAECLFAIETDVKELKTIKNKTPKKTATKSKTTKTEKTETKATETKTVTEKEQKSDPVTVKAEPVTAPAPETKDIDEREEETLDR